MSVLKLLTCVPSMLLVPTLREGTTAHVIKDTVEMDFLVKVYMNLNIMYT